MKHDIIIIGVDGKIKRNNYNTTIDLRSISRIFNQINYQPLQVSRILMTQEDYDDIVAWDKNDS